MPEIAPCPDGKICLTSSTDSYNWVMTPNLRTYYDYENNIGTKDTLTE